MKKLQSYLNGAWQAGEGAAEQLVNPATDAVLAETSTKGLDIGKALEASRNSGELLRAMTFAERGALLAKMTEAIFDKRDELIQLAIDNGGNTRGDAKFDIDGATATLNHYAELGAKLGSVKVLADGPLVQLGKNPRWVGGHAYLPLQGVAVLINAFNFPAWNYMEKAACAILAGMPIFAKPGTSTCMVAHRVTELIAPVMPAGTLSLLCGRAGDLLKHVGPQDVIAFTGSAATGNTMRASSARVNVEADSLNAAVIGPDVEAGSATYDMFIREAAKEMTQKAGQKCTATRRIFAPASLYAQIQEDLAEALKAVVYGNPADASVKMGPVTNHGQLDAIVRGIKMLGGKVITGGERGRPVGSDKGAFIAPTLLAHDDAFAAKAVHEHEVFGPVSSVLRYDGTAKQASALVALGQGSLVGSVYSDDEKFCDAMLHGAASFHGRLYFGSEKIAEQAFGPGTVLAGLVHGGPGRAGGGEELGGDRGLRLYSQRTAVQGSKPMLERMLCMTPSS